MNENLTVVEQQKWIADVRHGVLALLSRSDAGAQIGIDFSPRLFKVAVVLVSAGIREATSPSSQRSERACQYTQSA